MFEFCGACQSAERPWAMQRQRQGEYIRKKARVRGRAPLTKGVVSGEITLISYFERHEVSRVVGPCNGYILGTGQQLRLFSSSEIR